MKVIMADGIEIPEGAEEAFDKFRERMTLLGEMCGDNEQLFKDAMEAGSRTDDEDGHTFVDLESAIDYVKAKGTN